MAPPSGDQPLLMDNGVVTMVEYAAVIQLFGFLAAIWAGGQVSNFLKVTSLVRTVFCSSVLPQGRGLTAARTPGW